MDPNLFHLDWERTLEVLATIVILSLFVERAMAVVFESPWWVAREQLSAWREPAAVIVAFAVCRCINFDALSMIVLSDHTHWIGEFITAVVIAGGSKGSIKLFHDVFKIQSSAYRNRKDLRKAFKAQAGGERKSATRPKTAEQ